MPAVRGSNLLVKRGNGDGPPETFTTIGAIQNATLNLNGESIEVTTGDDVDVNNAIWRTFIHGPKELSVSGNGIGKALEPLQSIYNDWATDQFTDYEIVVPNLGTFTVTMIVESMEFIGPYDGVQGFSFSLKSSAAPAFVAET